ncbi:MAG: hypothetical protein IJC74_03035 [Clostridia bacterium]|nr:hypothetical protein [Clostridia bacterium]
MKNKQQTDCETCANYVYDEEFEDYGCQLYLDEDEMNRFLSFPKAVCPYYKFGDEYDIVKKQI